MPGIRMHANAGFYFSSAKDGWTGTKKQKER